MNIFNMNNTEFKDFIDNVESVITNISVCAKDDDIARLKKFKKNFEIKIKDFYQDIRENKP